MHLDGRVGSDLRVESSDVASRAGSFEAERVAVRVKSFDRTLTVPC